MLYISARVTPRHKSNSKYQNVDRFWSHPKPYQPDPGILRTQISHSECKHITSNTTLTTGRAWNRRAAHDGVERAREEAGDYLWEGHHKQEDRGRRRSRLNAATQSIDRVFDRLHCTSCRWPPEAEKSFGRILHVPGFLSTTIRMSNRQLCGRQPPSDFTISAIW